MPFESDFALGNLQNYKMYLRPNAHLHYGTPGEQKSKLNKHQQNVQTLLKIMSKNESLTTWDLAKISIPNDMAKLREREKIYRRLLVGRKDNGKHSDGILDLGLAIKDGKSLKTGIADKYRLSLYGILYCIDVLDFSNNEIDKIAEKYSKVLPKVFGKWDYLKSKIGDRIYGIKLLANGLLADNPQIQVQPGIPFYELMSYVHIKYQRNFESISEEQLAEQISYWFYTNLLYNPVGKNNSKSNGIKSLDAVFEDDHDLKKWFLIFFRDTIKYYQQRYSVLKKSDVK
ncbi:hypothetical protein [Nitrosopumilus ureiphilus]|uniref:Uncharacterized protein n=1 Tax=Nitrosopumilus ureiphilus TaxID=1470067 RepID=A0A7D5M6G6_9ARCH|nr:hypothetical protein [Nitrosopumilus ureiphilus]QLH06107.1 hypothetical protein C5F50_02715 [Nitrosopumilus ureiphilus]